MRNFFLPTEQEEKHIKTMPWVGAYLFWYLFCKKVRNRLKYLIYMIVKCLQHIQVEKSFCSSVFFL